MAPARNAPFDKEWIRAYFAEVDRLDPDALVEWYDGAGTFRFANQPAARGREAIADTLRQFYGAIREMTHRETGIWTDEASGVFEAEVTFTRADGSEVTIPAVSVIRVDDGLVWDFRMVMDATPVTGHEATA